MNNFLNGRLGKKDRVISSERFSLVDKHGQERAAFGLTPAGHPALMMARKDGTSAILIGFDEATGVPAVALMDGSGRERLTLQILEVEGQQSPALFMRDSAGASVIVAGVNEKGEPGFTLGAIDLAAVQELRAEQIEKQQSQQEKTQQ